MTDAPTKYAYVLIKIENWNSLKSSNTYSNLQMMESRFSDLVSQKYGESFRSILLNSGELFVILKSQEGDKSIIKSSSELKHQLKMGVQSFAEKLSVSIVIGTKCDNMDAYDVLLHLRNVLNICKAEQHKEILCVA